MVKKKSILNSLVLVAIWEPAINYRSAYNYPVSESKLELKLSPTAGFRIIFVVVDSTTEVNENPMENRIVESAASTDGSVAGIGGAEEAATTKTVSSQCSKCGIIAKSGKVVISIWKSLRHVRTQYKKRH